MGRRIIPFLLIGVLTGCAMQKEPPDDLLASDDLISVEDPDGGIGGTGLAFME